MKMRDPNGVELKQVLLQIIDRDEHGPITLRVRRDHEQIDLSDARHRTFLLVWTADDQTIGEPDLNNLISELEHIKELQTKQHAHQVALDRKYTAIKQELAALEIDNKAKTEALRAMQREQDPERVAIAVAAAVEERTSKLETQLFDARKCLVETQHEVDELKTSKRRLKEANERLKQGRK